MEGTVQKNVEEQWIRSRQPLLNGSIMNHAGLRAYVPCTRSKSGAQCSIKELWRGEKLSRPFPLIIRFYQ